MKLIPDTIDLSQYRATEGAQRNRHLPWSPEAEQSTLGCLLLSNDCADDVLPVLCAEDFFNATHQLIFKAIEALVLANKPADVITVHEHLKRIDQAEKVGGLQYLHDISMSVVSARNAGQYADIVRSCSLRRKLVGASDQALDIASSHPDPDQALDRIATLFTSIDRSAGKSEPRRIGDALLERLNHWNDMASGEVSPGIPTGFPMLDRALGGGLKGGRVIVLGARPSVGKTSLGQQVGIGVALQGHGVLICSQEMPMGELADRASANLAGVDLGSISEGTLSKEDWPRLTEAVDKVKDCPLYIDDQPSLTLLDIRAKARHVRSKVGLKLVIVDYLQLCSGSTQRGSSRHHEIEGLSRGLKALAKELDACVLVLSQLNRDVARGGREPTLADLKESGAIEEDADVAILLDPRGPLPSGSRLVAAILAKNRQGKRGRLALSFDGRTQRWAESTADVSSRGVGQHA